MPPKRKAAVKAKAGTESKQQEPPVAEMVSKGESTIDAPLTDEDAPADEDSVQANGDATEEASKEPVPDPKSASDDKKPSKKRKQPAEPKAARKGARTSARGAAATSKPSTLQLLKYLLSTDAEHLVRPEDEAKAIQERRDTVRTYSSSVLNPFEELLCAMILSRPISHVLGMRTIRTVLNDPYNFTSAKAAQSAGAEKRLQALRDAHTQHKDKTADQIGALADVVLDKYTSDDDAQGTQLKKLLSACQNDIGGALHTLEQDVKGFGKTGSSIFLRRVQWLWDSGFPYVDPKSEDFLRNLGLPRDGEGLQKAIEENWKQLDTKQIAGGNEAAKKRRAFVVVLERAVGADLENKLFAVQAAAARS